MISGVVAVQIDIRVAGQTFYDRCVNLGFIRPAVAKAGLDEIGIEDLRDQKIISFSRQNLSYTDRRDVCRA